MLQNLKKAQIQAAKGQAFDIIINEPRLYIDSFQQLLTNLKRLGYLQLSIDIYEATTIGDSSPIQALRKLLGPEIDRIGHLKNLGQFNKAIQVFDKLIEDDLMTSRALNYGDRRGVQAQLGFLVRALRIAKKSDLAHAFFEKRVGGRLDIGQQSLFRHNPYVVRQLLYVEAERKDAKAIERYLLPLVKYWFELRKKGVRGWRPRETYHWEMHHMLNELRGHCNQLKNYEPIVRLLISIETEQFEEIWPRYSYLKAELSKAPSWKRLNGVLKSHRLMVVPEFLFALSPQDIWVQWPLQALLPHYLENANNDLLRKELELQLMRCLTYYTKSRKQDSLDRRNKKKEKPQQRYKVVALLKSILRSEIQNIVSSNEKMLNQFALSLLESKCDRELDWVMERFFDLIRRNNLYRNKRASGFQKGRAVFFLEWYL
ncbi:MAG: hypothetical protein P1V97_33770, partial [Planctomycetota bacterium]|nr:hypothetical protein [Planctomycetota bacterium]